MPKNPMYGQNKSDAISGSAFVTVGLTGMGSAGQRYCVCPIDGARVSSMSFVATTAVTTAASAITVKDGAGDTIGTGSVPVLSQYAGALVASGLESDSDSALNAGDVIEIEFDGASGAGAGDMVVQFVQAVGY